MHIMNNNVVVVVEMSEGELLKTPHQPDDEGRHKTLCVPSVSHDDDQRYCYLPLYRLDSGNLKADSMHGVL